MITPTEAGAIVTAYRVMPLPEPVLRGARWRHALLLAIEQRDVHWLEALGGLRGQLRRQFCIVVLACEMQAK